MPAPEMLNSPSDQLSDGMGVESLPDSGSSSSPAPDLPDTEEQPAEAEQDQLLIEEEVEEEEEEEVEEEYEEEVEQEVDEQEEAVAANPSSQQVPEPAQPAVSQEEGASAAEVTAADDIAIRLRALETQVRDKLQTGMAAALQQLGGAQTVSEATSNLTKMAGGWSAGLTTGISWLTGSDAPASGSKAKAMQLTTSKASNEMQIMFNLDDAEQLVESFKCKLLQTYTCAHNTYTPSIQMAFQGTLHITDAHVCFGIEERGKQLPVKVPLKLVSSAARQLPPQKGGGSDILRLGLEGTKFVAFKDFEAGGGALDSALALIEHLTSTEE